MIRVAMIGAGSIGFTRRLMMDLVAVEEFRDTEFRFMDIDKGNLRMAVDLGRQLLKANGVKKAKIVGTTDRRKALRDADYVFCMVRVGGLEAFAHDIEIPLKYGVDQCVGDTLAPGGVFYALRTIPVLLGIAEDMRAVCPNALLMNYSNPMAMNTWAVRRAGGIRVVGLCHGVQGGHQLIANALGLPANEVDYICAGINHQTWYIQVTHKGMDMLPFLARAMEENPGIARREPCRIDVLKKLGFFSTESNGHLSEYLPWYRKRKKEMSRWICKDVWITGPTGGYLKHCRTRTDEYRQMFPKWMSGEAEYIQLGQRSHEHGSYIVEALETGRMYRGHFNVANTGLIPNLPDGCTIEIPGYVDRTGLHPIHVGPLPMACAATCRASISVQEMTVEAALTGNRDLVKQALLHDPLTAAVCNTDEVCAMADEMFEALAPWLPQFNGQGARWSDIPQPMDGLTRFPKAAGDWLPPSLRGEGARKGAHVNVGHKDS